MKPLSDFSSCISDTDEMSRTGKLTVEQICDIHRVLMDGLQKDAGDVRKGIAYITWNDKDYFYSEPMVTEQLFYACIDHHCTHMTHYEKLAQEAPSVESFRYLFKCAA